MSNIGCCGLEHHNGPRRLVTREQRDNNGAPRPLEYVPDPMELEDHVPMYIPEPEHPEDLVPVEDEAPIEPYITEVASVPTLTLAA
ncbi:hypothetical protein Tco_0617994 [Tanacetum coccineum]